jgi:hypothetical protein
LHFQLTDAEGVLLPDDDAAGLVAGECRVQVSVAGAQVLEPTCARYDPVDDKFQVIWNTARRPRGQVAVTVAVTSTSRTDSIEIAAFELV